MANQPSACIYGDQSNQTVPVLLFQSQGRQVWICPKHLPILIHNPVRLADELPGLKLAGSPESHS
jgi:hypothetical protein